MTAAIDHARSTESETKLRIPWSPPVHVYGMRSKAKRDAEKKALQLLKSTFRQSFAVEPVGIAKRLGVVVLEADFKDETLGALFMKAAADPEIVLNRRHGFFRRRSTCALELGHYICMSARTNEYKRVDLRQGFDQVGGQADDEYAEEFGACLLMPKEEVQILADLRLDDLDMAIRFRVPREEMQKRLGGLGLGTFDLEAA